MTPAEIIASLDADLNDHRQQLRSLSMTLLGEGWIVADEHVRTVQDAAKCGGTPGRLALAPYGKGLCGTLHFTRARAEQVAAAIVADGVQVQAIHVTDWHRRRITAVQSAREALLDAQGVPDLDATNTPGGWPL